MFQAIGKAQGDVPWPENIAVMAEALAQGMTIVADIKAVSMNGFAAGGYTGAGGRYDVAGVVHAGEGVLSAPEVSALGGEAGFHALRASLRNGFAEGGYVSPLAGAPSPAQLGFPTSAAPRMDIGQLASASSAASAAPSLGVRIVNSVDPGFVTDAMNSAAGEKIILNHISRNQTKIKQMVS